MQNSGNAVNIRKIIEKGKLITHFQPIVSIKKNSVIGFEALSRGTGADTLIPPLQLFDAAGREALSMELDRLCRTRAFESYVPARGNPDRYILSVNLDPSILKEEAAGTSHLLGLVESIGMQPGKILVEINDSKIDDVEELQRLASVYRDKGFLLAFDDIGTELSKLDRVNLIKPDILKIDTSLVRDAAVQRHSREIVKSLVSLAHRLGSLVIAEGVETEEEAVIAIRMGIDMLQGYYFARPGPDVEALMGGMDERIEAVAVGFKERTVQKINAKKLQHRSYNRIINNLISELSRVPVEQYDASLSALIKQYPELECVYILDEEGIQISDTIFSVDGGGSKGFFFQPGDKGADQSSKDYYFLLAAGLPKYTTDPYISLASRNICITISVAYRDVDFQKRILCMDIIQDNEASG